MNCFMAFRLSPSGFPLYLCSLNLRLARKTSSFPNLVPESLFQHPLAKDAAPIPNALGATNI